MEKEKKVTKHYLLSYFVFFSIFGLLMETLFCYITTGVLESRKGLLIGPFCPIYGVGAVVLICFLEKVKDDNKKIVIFGAILGTVVEYVLSYILEALYGSRFWNYEDRFLNLNGRVCLLYAFYWGMLSLLLMKTLKPNIDKLIDKIPVKENIIDSIIIIFFIINTLLTVWAVCAYQARVENKYYNKNVKTISSGIILEIEEKWFSNEYMLKVFPNLRLRTPEGKEIFIKNLINQES